MGDPNVAIVQVEGAEVPALIDTGAQVSLIDSEFCRAIGVTPQPLGDLLKVQGFGGYTVPYEGYVEVTLTIPGMGVEGDVLLLVTPPQPEPQEVPVLLGTIAIDLLLGRVARGTELETAWGRAKVSRDCVKEQEERPNYVRNVKTIELPAHQVTQVPARSAELMQIETDYVFIDPDVSLELPSGVVCLSVRDKINRAKNEVLVCLMNTTDSPVTLPSRCKIGRISAIERETVKVCENRYGGSRRADSLGPVGVSLPEQLNLDGLKGESPENQRRARELLQRYASIFSQHSKDLGHTKKVKHKIELIDPKPFKERYRRIPPQMYEKVRQHLTDMLSMGAISHSRSPWASAIVLVRKKDGELRFCIDLRRLNLQTKKDAYPLPRIEEALDCLLGAQWFTSLDLQSGYWQVELDEASKELTAFTVGPLGFYQCERMPFGLVNAPATFQRLMESCLGDLHLRWCLIYLDDIVVFSKTFDDQLERLDAVLSRLQEAGLKLKPSKCEFFKTEIQYLGHIVSREGISTVPGKVEAVKKWPIPVTVTDVRSFLGFVGYYRKFIPKFGVIAHPLNQLLSGERAKKGSNKVEWSEDCNEAFDRLRAALTQAPILAYADFSLPFHLHTDASMIGLGAALYQEQGGVERVIAYASRSLSDPETRYAVHKLEFLALKWAVTEKFHEYLYGSKFTVHTDNNPLTYVLSTAKLDATGQRWVASLAPYQFDIKYRSGKSNVDADALSRIPWRKEDREGILDPDMVDAIMTGALNTVPAYKLAVYPVLAAVEPPVKSETEMTEEDWARIQQEDPVLGPVYRSLHAGEKTPEVVDDPDYHLLCRQRGSLKLRGAVMYRKCHYAKRNTTVMQLVLPHSFRKKALEGCHDKVGHPGAQRTMSLLLDRFYWPMMQRDCERHVDNCKRCKVFKSLPERAPLGIIECTRPLEIVHTDFLTIEGQGTKVVNVLVMTDHFTRYAQAYLTCSQTAKQTAKIMWEQFITHYGFPESLLSDQGRNFESALIKELCTLAGTKKIRTTPYHPMGNGQCERFNRTLISMLGTLEQKQKTRWKEHVQALTFAYNATQNETTGFSPYYLMFGRNPRLPVDAEFGLPPPTAPPVLTTDYVKGLKERLAWAMRHAEDKAKKQKLRHKKIRDKKQTGVALKKGDRVLVRVVAHKGKHKIQDRWHSEIYKVIGQPYKDIPVYKIELEDGSGKPRVLHRNLLLPIGGLLGGQEDCGQSSGPGRPTERSAENKALTLGAAAISGMNGSSKETGCEILSPSEDQPSASSRGEKY